MKKALFFEPVKVSLPNRRKLNPLSVGTPDERADAFGAMRALGLAILGLPFSLLRFFWAGKRNEGNTLLFARAGGI
jgi:hypothetical protein